MISSAAKKNGRIGIRLLLCLALMLQVIWFIPSEAAAASSDAIKQVKEDYLEFEKQEKDAYNTIKKQMENEYKSLLEAAKGDHDELLKKASDDYKALSKTYSSRALDSYYSEIYRIGRAIDNYYGEIYRISKAMDRYYGDVYRMGGALDLYYGEIYRIGFILDNYYGEVYRVGKTVDKFERSGGSSQDLINAMQKIQTDTKNDLDAVKVKTKQAFADRRAEVIQTLCETKSTAIRQLNEARKNLTGQELDYGTFGIDSMCEKPIRIFVDGEELKLTQPAVIIKGNTLVPMRTIFEALGAEVKWNGSTQTVTAVKEKTTIVLPIGKKTAQVNGNNITLTTPAQLINQTTMVPLRFVGEALGADVRWNGSERTITITTK